MTFHMAVLLMLFVMSIALFLYIATTPSSVDESQPDPFFDKITEFRNGIS